MTPLQQHARREAIECLTRLIIATNPHIATATAYELARKITDRLTVLAHSKCLLQQTKSSASLDGPLQEILGP